MAVASERVSMNEVIPLLKEVTEWEELGLYLGLSMPAIMEISRRPGVVDIKRTAMMTKLLQSDLEATWDKLAKALLNMDYKVLSSQIRKKYCSSDAGSTQAESGGLETAEPYSEKSK